MRKLVIKFLAVLLYAQTTIAAPLWTDGVAVLDGFPVALTERVFNHALSTVSQRYLWSVNVPDLVTAMLAEVTNIDPDVRITRDSGRMVVYHHNLMLRSFKTPDTDNIKAWSKLPINALIAARQKSNRLREVSPEEIREKMLAAMLSQLDDFSKLNPKVKAEEEEITLAETGIRFRKAGRALEVLALVPNSPAETSGLKEGDLITDINGEQISPMNRAMIIERLNGSPQSTIILSLAGSDTKIAFRREIIPPNNIDVKVEENLLVMTVHDFREKTAERLQKAIIREQALPYRIIEGLVLDLRSNSGGLLDEAVAVADLFLNKGVIVYTEGRHSHAQQVYEATEGDISNGMPLAVLIDAKSASAAEIVAAAIQDHGRGVIVGSVSYGKGTVQTVVSLPDDSSMSLTWARFHAPSGYSLHGLGVLPTLCNLYWKDQAPEVAANKINLAFDANETPHDLALWRRIAPDDNIKQKEMRELCPMREEFGTKPDLAAARKILTTPQYYEPAVRAGAWRR